MNDKDSISSRSREQIFPFTATSRPALGPNQWIPASLSLRVKRSGREADHSPPYSAGVKNAWSYTSTPPHILLRSAPVTTARRFLGFRVEDMDSRYGKVAANLLNEHSLTSDKGWCSILLRNFIPGLRLGRNDLDNRKWI
jgi:hypothetical protein